MKRSLQAIVLISIILAVGSWAFAQATAGPTAKDPVCGMSVKVEGAKYSAAYEGKTYYFCSEGCKTEFLKNPAKYAGGKAPEAEGESAEGCGGGCGKACAPSAEMTGQAPMAAAHDEAMKSLPKIASGCGGGCCCMRMMQMMQMMHGMHDKMNMMGHGLAGHGAMMMEMGDLSVENTADGVVVRFTSKDPAVVKMIQERWAARMKARDAKTCPMKKPAEAKKEK
jgi:YHS domain-containing protein